MKNYTYTARDKSGAIKRGSLTAADRNAVFQELKLREMVPLSVNEGGKMLSPSPKIALPGKVIVSAALLVTLMAGILLFLFLAPQEKAVPKALPKAAVRAEGKAAVEAVAAKKQEPALAPTNAVAQPVPEPKLSEPEQATQPAPLTETGAHANAPEKTDPHRRVSATLTMGGATNKIPDGYSSGTERLINMIVNTKKGMPPPPLVNITPGADIAKILNTDIGVYDEDSERMVEKKANVAQAKQMLKDYLKEGGTTDAFLKYYHNELKQAAETRKAAQKQMSDLAKAGDLDGARRYMEAQNKELGAKGIMLLTPHPTMLDK